MTGLVLTEEEISAIYEYSLERFVDQDVIESLIATIRDRDKQIEYWKGHEVIQILVNQNSILREALQEVSRVITFALSHQDKEILGHVEKISREALAKVSQKEVSTPDEPNRNAQTE